MEFLPLEIHIIIIFFFSKWDDNLNLVVILFISLILPWTFGLNMTICEPGQRVTDQFNHFREEVVRCEWNNLSIKMRRMYLIFLTDSQQPKHIRSYGGILCTRNTFKQVHLNDIQILNF